jgi:cell wall-associated NlpC family hydrolase
VTVLEAREGWARVRTADDYSGWMSERAVRSAAPYAVKGRVAQVGSLFANIYREPNVAQHEPLVTVPFEARLEVVAEPADNLRWLEVRLPDDRAGWVQRGDVGFDAKPLSIAETIALARRFLGLPYTWGGTSTYGYDCSGFTQMLVRRRGILMPRDAAPQARWSGVAPVDAKDLQPGDLLYFGSSVEKITHTGMYIGEGKFIHATTWTHPVVQISELKEPHWTSLLVASRRLK